MTALGGVGCVRCYGHLMGYQGAEMLMPLSARGALHNEEFLTKVLNSILFRNTEAPSEFSDRKVRDRAATTL